MIKRTAGILALLGLAGSAFAYWKYRNLSPEEKADLKNKVKNVKDEIKDAAVDVKDTISEEFEKFKSKAKSNTNEATT